MLFLGISIVMVVIERFVLVYLTPLMIIRTVENLTAGKTPKNEKYWVSIEKISPNMVLAVVFSEDNLFLTHSGFSFGDGCLQAKQTDKIYERIGRLKGKYQSIQRHFDIEVVVGENSLKSK